jgi:hypothetical protein
VSPTCRASARRLSAFDSHCIGQELRLIEIDVVAALSLLDMLGMERRCQRVGVRLLFSEHQRHMLLRMVAHSVQSGT